MVLIARRNHLERTRTAVAAGRSVGGAVKRNRAKRRIRAVIRAHQQQIAPGWDLILLARRPIHAASHADLVGALTDVLQRANLWVA